jgi:predicted Holliday junction resolvase-like endonuclease
MGPSVIVIVAIAVLLPVMLVCAVEVYKRHVSYKERQFELMADRTAEKAAQYAAQVERLEERMRVMERIATDGGVNIARQIENLRDQPSAGKEII